MRLDRRYSTSVAAESGMDTGSTWTEDGKKRQAGPLVSLRRLYICTPAVRFLAFVIFLCYFSKN